MTDNKATLTAKVALITGGSRGIGKACALKLAKSGCNIVITYFNSSDLAQEVCDTITKLGRKAYAIQVNLANAQSIPELFDEFSQHFTHLDILVSNAASGVLKPGLDLTPKHWRWCMDTNALALQQLVRYACPLMPNGSRIVALSSLGSQRAIPYYAFIGASKAAVEALVRHLSIELAASGISINAISAGVVDTDALQYFPNRQQLLDKYAQQNLAGTPLQTSDVANAVYLLCLPEANMIKGQVIYVDAGYSIIG